MTAEIIYKGQFRTEMKHLKSGQIVETDAPTDNQGKGERFSPTDLLASALGSCMLTIMGIKAQSLGIEESLRGATLELKKIMASAPRRVSEIHVIIRYKEEISIQNQESLEAAALACPVAKSLHPDLIQKVEFIEVQHQSL